MDTTTAPPAVGPVSGVPSPSHEPGSEAAFGDLVERGLFNEEPAAPRQIEPEESWSATDERKPPQEEPAKELEKDDKEVVPEKKAEEGKEYASLDDYLKEAKLDPETFMQLPVTVKVDGTEQRIPLAEALKSYQLSSASYNRMNELASQRTAFVQEQTQVRQALGVQIQRTETLLKAANDTLLGDFAQWTPDKLAQLRATEPGQYAALVTDYNSRVSAIQGLTQQAEAARQEQARHAEDQRRASLPGEREKMLQGRPEWRDPAKFTESQKQIRDYASSRGFTDAELNSIFDHRYMLTLADAASWRQLQASQSATVARVRTAPKMAKPGTRQATDPKGAGLQQAQERWAKSGFRDNDAGAAVFEQFA